MLADDVHRFAKAVYSAGKAINKSNPPCEIGCDNAKRGIDYDILEKTFFKHILHTSLS